MTSFQVHISFWIIIVFWETAPYPSPKPTLTLNSHLRQNVGLGEGWGGGAVSLKRTMIPFLFMMYGYC